MENLLSLNSMYTYDDESQLVKDKFVLENVMNEASMPLQAWASNKAFFFLLTYVVEFLLFILSVGLGVSGVSNVISYDLKTVKSKE